MHGTKTYDVIHMSRVQKMPCETCEQYVVWSMPDVAPVCYDSWLFYPKEKDGNKKYHEKTLSWNWEV